VMITLKHPHHRRIFNLGNSPRFTRIKCKKIGYCSKTSIRLHNNGPGHFFLLINNIFL